MESRASDPWYPVPTLENPQAILREIINDKIPERTLQIKVEASQHCLGKNLTLKLSFKGGKEVVSIAINKNKESVIHMDLP